MHHAPKNKLGFTVVRTGHMRLFESATVLRGKGKVRIFQEVVCEDDEFSHESCEGKFFRFSSVEKALVESLEDGVKSGSHESCHVENRADM